MNYKQIKVNSLINKITKKDTLFGGDYTIDPYQNCEFGCQYCDSSLDKTIYIKINAVEILKEELINYNRGNIIIGSVHDPYQKVEISTKITRELLKIISESKFSCHILTKSDLVLRDIDILKKIKKSLVTISLSSMDDYVSKIFEKNAPLPSIRLKTVKKLSDAGINVGIANIPILPYITDEEIENIINTAKKNCAKFFLYKHLELKGDMKLCFFNIIKNYYPPLIEQFNKLYKDSYLPKIEYISKLNKKIEELCNIYELDDKV
ncbi:MAG: hypothetical protein AYK22_03810 [Thermoplasmatales archaeon SG8-52-3]|nr:MAG: hypothetical protein AYK22_03810 [Thermoplasmatales archaeon SG8-52-3]